MPGNYAKTLYVKIIQPILKNNEVFIDKSLHEAKASGGEALEAAAELAAEGASAAMKTKAGRAAVQQVAAAAVSAAVDNSAPEQAAFVEEVAPVEEAASADDDCEVKKEQ